MKTSKLLLASALLVQSVAVFAQDETEDLVLAYGDNATVSIATGSKQSLRNAPAVATVITAEEIAAMGATDLDQVMETVPGVHVMRDGPDNTPVYSFRGNIGSPTNPRVLMLQNGISVNSLYRGDQGQSWGGLPVENIARIEIIRGPGSALYGADAFAGVINIITKTAADINGTEFGVRAGSFNSKDVWVQHGSKLGDIDVAAYLRVGRTDGYKGIVSSDAATRVNHIVGGSTSSLAPGPEHNDVDAVDAGLDLGYGKWRFRAGYKMRDMGQGAGLTAALDPHGKEKSERITTDLSWTDPQFSENWGLGFDASYLSYSEVVRNAVQFPPGTVFPGGNTFPNGMIGTPGRWERQVRIGGYATYSGFADQNWRIGLGHEDLDLYKVRTMKNFYLNAAGVPTPDLGFNGGAVVDYSGKQPHVLPHDRLNNYVYVQDEWSFAHDWMLTAGVRRDNFSDFGATTNPRLAVTWDAKLDVTAKLLYGKAFRAPAFGELVGVNPVANGNPNLRPESSRTLEAAISWQVRRDLALDFNVFRYKVTDAILAVPSGVGNAATFQNTGEQEGQGTEVQLVWDVNRDVRFTGSYSHQKAVTAATQTDLGYAPHHHLYARTDWRLGQRWLLSPQVNWIAGRQRAAGDTRPSIPNYTSVDLTLRTDRGKGQWSFAGGVRNLFNTTILEPSLFQAAPANRPDISTSAIPNDLPMPGRTWFLQATYSL